MHAEGFTVAETASKPSFSEDDKRITLAEITAILELHSYSKCIASRNPICRTLISNFLAGVAAAAEKYRVYSAS